MGSNEGLQLRTDDERRENPLCKQCILYHASKGLDVDALLKTCHGVYEEEDFTLMATIANKTILDSYLEDAEEFAVQFHPEWEPEEVATYQEALAEEEILTEEMFKEIFDPVYFHSKHLAEDTDVKELRPKQVDFLKCTSQHKSVRYGRRGGKSVMFAIDVIHKVYTEEGKDILMVVPGQTQVDIISESIEKFNATPKIKEVHKATKLQPYYLSKYINGSKISIMIASGNGKTIRGQKSSDIYLDETDYIEEDIIRNAVLPIESDRPDVTVTIASTPSGERKFFYESCQEDDEYREFYAPSRDCIPHWDAPLEKRMRSNAGTPENYDREYEALFGETQAGVFRKDLLIDVRKEYEYPLPYNNNLETYIGVDWNGDGNGTRIIVVGLIGGLLHVMHKIIISQKEFTNTKAIKTIAELNRVYRPKKICIDKGFGAMQDELMRQIGKQALASGDFENPDCQLLTNLITVDFGENIELMSLTHKYDLIKRRSKVYMVENLKRLIENGLLVFPKSDTELFKQMDQYKIKRYDISGQPTFKKGAVGDHDLDALMLACFGFAKVNSPEFVTGSNHPIYVKIVSFDNRSVNAVQNYQQEQVTYTPQKTAVKFGNTHPHQKLRRGIIGKRNGNNHFG